MDSGTWGVGRSIPRGGRSCALASVHVRQSSALFILPLLPAVHASPGHDACGGAGRVEDMVALEKEQAVVLGQCLVLDHPLSHGPDHGEGWGVVAGGKGSSDDDLAERCNCCRDIVRQLVTRKRKTQASWVGWLTHHVVRQLQSLCPSAQLRV